MRPLAATALALALLLAPSRVRANPAELRWSAAVDVPVTVAAGLAWIVTEALKPDLAPARCRWCAADGVDLGVRDALVWRTPSAADTASNVTAFVLAPAAAAGADALIAAHDASIGSVPLDTLLIAEATLLAADLDQLTKLLVGRERPFVHALDPDAKSRTTHPSDNNLSFFSGHTTETFALAAATGTVATLRGYRWAPASWVAGGALAAVTGYLRIAADKHWLTDVVVGMLIGAGVGVAVPLIFHRRVADAADGGSGQATSPLSLGVVW
jgi:membrane-associated phospholipid phosphatase